MKTEEFDYYLPSKGYIATCEEGYEDFGFDYKFLDQALETTKDNIASRLTKRLTID